MKVAIGNDRKGMSYKKGIAEYLLSQWIEVINVGSDEDVPSDYPIYAAKVANSVAKGEADFGILICSSGVGMSIAANKVKGIRCGIAYNETVAQRMREHNDANVIALGQDYIDLNDAIEYVKIFLSTEFLGKHHEVRIEQISDIENGKLDWVSDMDEGKE